MPGLSVESSSAGVSGPDGASLGTLNAGGRPLDELLRIAADAQRERRRLRLTGVGERTIEDLVRIAVTGGDCVSFASAAPDTRPSQTTPRRWFFRR